MVHLNALLADAPAEAEERARRRADLPIEGEWPTWDVVAAAERTLARITQTGLVRGADVSHHQGDVNFISLARAVRYVYLKATEGTTYVDQRYSQNRMRAAGSALPSGPYHFAHPGPAADLVAQAKFFRRMAGVLGPGDLLPALDIEVPGFTPAMVSVLRQETEQQFQQPIIVSYIATWILTQPGMVAALGGSLRWIPRYGPEPSVPWAMWQDTDAYAVAGVGTVDGNVTYRFDEFVIGKTTTPPPPAPPSSWQHPVLNAPIVGGAVRVAHVAGKLGSTIPSAVG